MRDASTGTGNTAELATIDVTTAYTYDATGSLTSITEPSVGFTLSVLDDLRLGAVARSTGESTSFAYDGRSFLRSADEALSGGYSRPTYSSEGVVHHLERRDTAAADLEDVSYLYFAGRPVAQYSEVAGGSSEWTYLTTDHLGTPLLATTESGVELWSGPLEPFGADALRDGPDGALEAGLRLRLPGQWEDEVWQGATLGADVYYNVHRWYEMGTGRYGRVDPIFWRGSKANTYSYGEAQPLFYIDRIGLAPVKNGSSRPIPYKPENEGGVIKLCSPGATCNVDGVYPPTCRDYPIKIVNGCQGEVGTDGKLRVWCPALDIVRKAAQLLIGGRTNAQFHRDHPDWLVPNEEPYCGCEAAPAPPDPASQP